MLELCNLKCGLDKEGKHICCCYCDCADACSNRCNEHPNNCGQTVVNDKELLDYALDKWLNMSRTELLTKYIKCNLH